MKNCSRQESCIKNALAKRKGSVICSNSEVTVLFGSNGSISLRRSKSISQCNDIGFPDCVNSTCREFDYLSFDVDERVTSRYVICASFCSDEKYCQRKPAYFQCADNSYIFLDQVNDGTVNCVNGSDELGNEDDLICDECVLRQNNLYENRVHFQNSSNVCSRHNDKTCFRCLDNSLHFSFAELCDGINDCYDMSDECFCEKIFDRKSCLDLFKTNDRLRSECKKLNFQHISFEININPRQVREKYYSALKSADAKNVFNKKLDCNTTSNFTNSFDDKQFSSITEMIASPVFRYAFWIIGFIVLLGNAYAIFSTIVFIKKSKLQSVFKFQHVIIFNIAIADFIMGIYLLTIAVHSAIFSGSYGSIDPEWRSSLKCSIIGSLSLVSSEASCFLMVVLTAFRLRNVSHPMKSLKYSLLPWKVCIVVAWLSSLCLGIVPIIITGTTSPYFVHSISFLSEFHHNKSRSTDKLKHFICSYAVLSNTTIRVYENNLKTILMFFETTLPDSKSVRIFGYYGETSECLQRFFVSFGDSAWEYTVFLITVNFLCFLFIAISCVVIFRRSFKFAEAADRNGPNNDAAIMQKRIARIIATDFCCWIPICIMTYVRFAIHFSNAVYQITAIFLFQINSALNPFLFSSLPDKLEKFFRSKLVCIGRMLRILRKRGDG